MKYCLHRISTAAVALSIVILAGSTTRADHLAKNPWGAGGSPGLDALAAAADEARFAYVLFWRDNDEATQRMNAVLQEASPLFNSDIAMISIRVNDPDEAEVVKIFGVDRAPLPLLAAVAPNGAVTKAWPLKANPEQLVEGLVSRGTASCLKAMQKQKLSLVCVLNKQTAYSAAVRLAASGFQADERFAAATEIIEIDPADANEQTFLASLKINPQTPEAIAILVSPTGQPIGTFKGAVTTADIITKVETAQQGCCPGGKCGPGGCCPGGQCGPQQK